jgi:uncharacterized damage-inducible protein DinB
MIEILQWHARYNSEANRTVLHLIKNQPKEFPFLPVCGYYKSVASLLSHILSVDIAWLFDLVPAFPDSCLNNPLIGDFPINHDFFPNPPDFEEKRRQVDDLLSAITSELSPEDFQKEIAFIGNDGKTKSRKTWQILMHIFNHQTHHRGQLSQLLDEKGIDNDFSNIIRVVDERESGQN